MTALGHLTDEKHRKLFLIGIFIFAFVLRLTFALFLPLHFFWPDEAGYYNIALNVSNGDGYTNERILVSRDLLSTTEFNSKNAFCFGPGLAFTLAGISLTLGDNITTMRIVQCLITSLLPILVFWVCIRLFNSAGSAYVAAVITVLYPYFIYISSIFYPQAIGSVLLALTILCFISWLRDGRARWLILTGITDAVACLFIVPMIFTIIPLGSILLYRLVLRRVSLLRSFAFLSCWAIIVGSYIGYASMMNNRFILITRPENVGLHSFNHPDLSAIEVLSHTWTQKSVATIEELNEEFKLSKDPQGSARQWFKQMLRDHPLLFIRNCLLRLTAFFAPVTFTITKNPHTGLVPNLIGLFIYFPLFVMSTAGLFRMTQHKDWAGLQVVSLLLFFLIPHVILIGSTRYRIPWDSLIICFASYYIASMLAKRVDTVRIS